MKVYTDAEAIKNFPILLDEAQRDGAIGIRREDGSTFVVAPEQSASPFDVAGVDLGLSADEIVAFVHEGRRSSR